MLSIAGWGADGDTFTSKTEEGVEVTYIIISEQNRICAVGTTLGTGYANPAIDRSYSGHITIPNETNGYSVRAIGSCAFWNCLYLTAIDLPKTIVTIDNYAFSSCIKLQEVAIPEGVTSLGFQSFYDCESLVTLSLPSTLQSIGKSCFTCNGRYRLSAIYSYIERPFAIEDIFYLLTDSDAEDAEHRPYRSATLYVPKGSKPLYETTAEWKRFSTISEMEDVVVKDNVSLSEGICTFCSPFDLDFTEVDGLQAYIASGFSPSTSTLMLTRVYNVPGGEGVLLKGESGDYEIPFCKTDMVYSNLLRGVTAATTVSPTDGYYSNFLLANGMFHPLPEEEVLAANKAYLQVPSTVVTSIKAFTLAFDDDKETDIHTQRKSLLPIEYYNLQGHRALKPAKGIYISNGKKVCIE